MFVRGRMTATPITIEPGAGVPDAQALLKLHDIKHLPVMEGDRMVGVVSRGDVARASPSSASSLDAGELTYLLSKIKVADIMRKKVLTIPADALLEEAATRMRDNRISFLPVMEGDRLVGVITESNIFDAFIDILGFRDPGTRLTIEVEDTGPGILERVAGIFAKNGVSVSSMALYRLQNNRCAILLGTPSADTAQLESQLAQAGFPISYKLTNRQA